MKRPAQSVHRILVITVLMLAPLTGAGAADTATPLERPNIVFILADDLGYGDVGCYGCTDIQTPVLDQLATEGVRFTDFYANAAVCSPTRIAFLTGRYQQRLGLDNALYYQEMGRGLPTDGETIADDLRSAGYTTGISGKWHVGYDRQRQPHQQGFDHFFGLLGGNHHYFDHMDRIGVPDLWLDNAPIKREGYSTDLITEDAITFIESHHEAPFFLYLSHAAPHFPYQAPGDRDKPVKPKTKSWQQGDRETYVAMVERMDDGIGKVLATLDALDLRQKTLVVFTSDNGGSTWSRNAPLRGEKSTIWEGGVRVPCLARWPGVLPEGQVTSQVGITMDWTATFRRLAGVANDDAGEDGMDLLPVLTGQEPNQTRTLFWRRKKGPVRKNVEEGLAVRKGKWKLIKQATGERYLFDLQSDIGETQNLIDQHPDLAANLDAELVAWEERVEAQ
ncbi:sulfatase [Roseiconus nitratireducens]|uniref:Sulfatase n=1 Tax=Roseiconus nitratireducens TaxID=2605748 RepID=A0A5M6CUF8_9BACT|nr:sulfatase [Roseiconus nitratireducens]KAA5537990.1 sulfatase [Roseiconus nitratireducens]